VSQTVSLDQLARLYAARNEANKRMGQALRTKDRARIADAKSQARDFNLAYDNALKAYKRQQKAERAALMRTTMIRWYLDRQEQVGEVK
jgi:hypothetical protein